MEIGLIFNCEWCGNRIDKAAALLFSASVNNMTRKHHMCQACYEKIEAMRIISNP